MSLYEKQRDRTYVTNVFEKSDAKVCIFSAMTLVVEMILFQKDVAIL